jgi:hypothetical protein
MIAVQVVPEMKLIGRRRDCGYSMEADGTKIRLKVSVLLFAYSLLSYCRLQQHHRHHNYTIQALHLSSVAYSTEFWKLHSARRIISEYGR